MAFFHHVWLGNRLDLSVLDQIYQRHASFSPTNKDQYCPILWLDQERKSMPAAFLSKILTIDDIKEENNLLVARVLEEIHDNCTYPNISHEHIPEAVFWLKLHKGNNPPIYVTVFLWEKMKPVVIQALNATLQNLSSKQSLPQDFNVLNKLFNVIDLTKQPTRNLLHIKSDTIRLIVLAMFGGIYLDMDILIKRLPQITDIPSDIDFMYRIAIESEQTINENDILFVRSRSNATIWACEGLLKIAAQFTEQTPEQCWGKYFDFTHLNIETLGIFLPLCKPLDLELSIANDIKQQSAIEECINPLLTNPTVRDAFLDECRQAKEAFDRKVYEFNYRIVWDHEFREEFLSVVQVPSPQEEEINNFYEQNGITKIFRKTIPSLLVNEFSFGVIFVDKNFAKEPYIKEKTTTWSNKQDFFDIDIESRSKTPKLYSWLMPGLRLAQTISTYKKILQEGESNPLCQPAKEEMSTILRQFPERKLNSTASSGLPVLYQQSVSCQLQKNQKYYILLQTREAQEQFKESLVDCGAVDITTVEFDKNVYYLSFMINSAVLKKETRDKLTLDRIIINKISHEQDQLLKQQMLCTIEDGTFKCGDNGKIITFPRQYKDFVRNMFDSNRPCVTKYTAPCPSISSPTSP